MRILFLDDSQPRHDAYRSWTIGHVVEHVHTVRQALAALKGERFDLASLDHDLCEASSIGQPATEPTGYDAAMALAEMPAERRPRAVAVHSMNPAGASRMVEALEGHVTRVYRAPFSQPSVFNVLKAASFRCECQESAKLRRVGGDVYCRDCGRPVW